MVELATPCSHPVFHPVNFLLLQSGQIEPTSCCFCIRQGLDPISDNSEVTQSGQIQGDCLACNSIWTSARISILMLHWVMVIKYETSMIVEFSLSVEFGIQPEHLFKHQIEFISNSAIPAKLASASLFAGQFRGDSTLIQTQFDSVSTV